MSGFACDSCGALNPPRLVPPPVGETRLITRHEPGPALTSNRETDAITALKRGLKEYLEQVYVDVAGARVRFLAVYDVWAEQEDVATFPSAAVLISGEASYDASSFTPSISASTKTADGQYLTKYSEATVTLGVEMHCSSPEERIAVSMMLEDALNPVDWMYGFRLLLPHYYNQIAVFEPTMTRMEDNAGDAGRGFRPGSVSVSARVSVLRARVLPGLIPSVRLEVLDP